MTDGSSASEDERADAFARALRALESVDAEERRRGARDLGESAAIQALPPLLYALGDRDPAVAAAAATALADLGDTRALPSLALVATAEVSAEVKKAATLAIRTLRDADEDLLLGAGPSADDTAIRLAREIEAEVLQELELQATERASVLRSPAPAPALPLPRPVSADGASLPRHARATRERAGIFLDARKQGDELAGEGTATDGGVASSSRGGATRAIRPRPIVGALLLEAGPTARGPVAPKPQRSTEEGASVAASAVAPAAPGSIDSAPGSVDSAPGSVDSAPERPRQRPDPARPSAVHPAAPGDAALASRAAERLGATVASTPDGYEVTISLGRRSQRVTLAFGAKDDRHHPLVLVQSVGGRATETNYRWALRLSLRLPRGKIAIRRIDGIERFVFCRTLDREGLDVARLAEAIEDAANRGDWIERQLHRSRDRL